MEFKDIFIYVAGIITVGFLLNLVFKFSLATAGFLALVGVTLIYLKLHK